MARPRKGSELSLSQLEQMLSDRRSQISDLERDKTKLQKQLDGIDQKIKHLGGSPSGKRHSAFNGAGRPKNEKNLADCIQVALAGSAAKSVGDVVDSVLAAGYQTKAKNFRNIVNQVLIKDKRFMSPARGTYQLKK